MRITLVINSLTGGGAEKVLVLLAKGFQQVGHSVSVITLKDTKFDVYNLPSNVNRIALGKQINYSNSTDNRPYLSSVLIT